MASQQPDMAAAEALSADRILVADDEEIIREMLFSYLTEEGYIVDTADNGIDAVAKARENVYSVVITDIRMPGVSGMEILKAAKETSKDTEVIVMTAFSTEDLAIEAVRLGAYDYLKKPVDDLGLFALLIRQVLQKQALARENSKLVDDLKVRNDELNSANAKLLNMATTDPLTGICNRRYILARLDQQFQQTMRYGEPFALVMMDLDHFKQVNDRYGHQVGDDVLRSFVDTVRKLIRNTDLFGRYGGEEFMLILHGTDPADAQRTAERLLQEVARTPCPAASGPIHMTVSLGLMSAPHPRVSTTEQLVKAADAALYRAKAEGRNRVVMAEESFAEPVAS